MDLNEAKTRLERYKGTLESSVKMYENTIKEMIERGADPESISFVLQMKKDAEKQLMEIKESLRSAGENVTKGKNVLFVYNEIVDKLFKSFNPYFCNRFMVDFGTNDIKDYFIEGVSYEDKLVVTFRNSEQFFVPEYFEKNKNFDKVHVFLLSPFGEKKAEIEFCGVEVEYTVTDDFTYALNNVLKTRVCFTFKSITHRTL